MSRRYSRYSSPLTPQQLAEREVVDIIRAGIDQNSSLLVKPFTKKCLRGLCTHSLSTTTELLALRLMSKLEEYNSLTRYQTLQLIDEGVRCHPRFRELIFDRLKRFFELTILGTKTLPPDANVHLKRTLESSISSSNSSSESKLSYLDPAVLFRRRSRRKMSDSQVNVRRKKPKKEVGRSSEANTRKLSLRIASSYVPEKRSVNMNHPVLEMPKLPPPDETAELLKSQALLILSNWHASYSVASQKLRIGLRYLQSVERIELPSDEELRRQTFLRLRFRNVRQEFESRFLGVVSMICVVIECVQILVPDFRFFDDGCGDDSVVNEVVSELLPAETSEIPDVESDEDDWETVHVPGCEILDEEDESHQDADADAAPTLLDTIHEFGMVNSSFELEISIPEAVDQALLPGDDLERLTREKLAETLSSVVEIDMPMLEEWKSVLIEVIGLPQWEEDVRSMILNRVEGALDRIRVAREQCSELGIALLPERSEGVARRKNVFNAVRNGEVKFRLRQSGRSGFRARKRKRTDSREGPSPKRRKLASCGDL